MFIDACYEVEYEYRLDGGQSVDLVARKGGEIVGVEVETGKSQHEQNIGRDIDCLRLGKFQKLFYIALSSHVAEHLLVLQSDLAGLFDIFTPSELEERITKTATPLD
jgi:Holliday junction resolvase-like predicted endonuclease